MDILVNHHKISIMDEPNYSVKSIDNFGSYKLEYGGDPQYRHACAHGIIVGEELSPAASAILLGVGGATGVNEHSVATYQEKIFVAVGDSVFALIIPTLELAWVQKVDFATCFGLFWQEEERSLISWGEVEICKLTISGEILWSFSGADIFTESFSISNKIATIKDFNGKIYRLNLDTGKSC